MGTLVADCSGTHVKVLANGHEEWAEIRSGPRMTLATIVAAAKATRVRS